MRRIAFSKGIIDRPNERSSHSVPMPRGGGFAIVVATVLLTWILTWLGTIELRLAISLIGGGLLVAGVGFMDDQYSIPAAWRFCAHLAAAIWAVYMLGGIPPVQIGDEVIDLGWTGDIVGAVAIVWVLNLFNFMDGIDGIAASEAAFVMIGGVAVQFAGSAPASVTPAAMIVGAGSLGFLVWNWPPAKIFMGDVGSGYLGFVIAVLALASARDNSVMIFVWLILGGVFFVDATVTLVRRLLRRERVYQAHRSHAYQWLSRRWQSHLRVTICVGAINLFWLLPLAFLCLRNPAHALWITAIALVPLVILALLAGAGRPETHLNKVQGSDTP